MQEIEIRRFNSTPWYKRRVLKMPAGLLCAILAFATIAAAAIVALGPFSAPVAQTPQTIFVGDKSGTAEPAYGGVESTLPYGSVDHVLVQAWQAGDSVSTTIHLVIKISASVGSCAIFAGQIGDATGAVGEITFDVYPINGGGGQVDIATRKA